MNYIEFVCENVRVSDRFHVMRKWVEMMDDYSFDMGIVGILHFSIMIALNLCFFNYMRRLPTNLLELNDWFNKSKENDVFLLRNMVGKI